MAKGRTVVPTSTPAQTFQGAPGSKSPDSPNFMPGGVVVPPHVVLNKKTGVGSVKKGGAVASPRPNVNAGKPVVDKPIQPVKVKPKGTPNRPNTSATPPPARVPAAAPAPPVSTLPGQTPLSTGYTPMSPQAMANLAKAVATGELNPLLQVWKDAISQSQTQGAAHDKAVSGFAAALANILKPVGGDVSNMYGTAADAVAGYGQGFSNSDQQVKQDAGANASGFNPNLTPGQQAEIAKSYAGTPYDVMYGLNGADPATSLRQVGTGLGAIYDKLPAAAGAYGQEWLGASQAAQLKDLQDLQTKQGEAAAQYPQLYQGALSNLQTQDRQNASLALTQAYENAQLGISARKTTDAENKIDPSLSKANRVQMHSDGTVVTGKDGKPIPYGTGTSTAPKVNTTLSKWYGILVDTSGKPIKNAKGDYIPVPMTAQNANTQYHGLTKAAATKLQAQASGLARIAHKPYTDSKGVTHAALSWQQYLDGALSKKIPWWVVIQEGKRVYSPAEIKNGLIPGQAPSG